MTENIVRLITKAEKVDEERLSTTQELISWLVENQENIRQFVFIGVTGDKQTNNESLHVAGCSLTKMDLVYLIYILNKWTDMIVLSPEDDA